MPGDLSHRLPEQWVSRCALLGAAECKPGQLGCYEHIPGLQRQSKWFGLAHLVILGVTKDFSAKEWVRMDLSFREHA